MWPTGGCGIDQDILFAGSISTLRKGLRSGGLDFRHDRSGVCIDLRLVRENISRVVRQCIAGVHLLQKLVERFFVVWKLHIRFVRLGFGRGIQLIEAGLIKRLHLHAFDLEGRSLDARLQETLRRNKTRLVKIPTERPVKRQRNHQADQQPVALFAAFQECLIEV